jgi:hypothetical protein
MSEDTQKNLRLMAYWLFTTVMIVFVAVSLYIGLWVLPLGASIWMIIRGALPITLITVLAAVIIYVGYYFLVAKKA